MGLRSWNESQKTKQEVRRAKMNAKMGAFIAKQEAKTEASMSEEDKAKRAKKRARSAEANAKSAKASADLAEAWADLKDFSSLKQILHSRTPTGIAEDKASLEVLRREYEEKKRNGVPTTPQMDAAYAQGTAMGFSVQEGEGS